MKVYRKRVSIIEKINMCKMQYQSSICNEPNTVDLSRTEVAQLESELKLKVYQGSKICDLSINII